MFCESLWQKCLLKTIKYNFWVIHWILTSGSDGLSRNQWDLVHLSVRLVSKHLPVYKTHRENTENVRAGSEWGRDYLDHLDYIQDTFEPKKS